MIYNGSSLNKLSILLGYEITHETLYKQAITCQGFANENKIIGNEGLSTVGDAVLKTFISIFLYDKNPNITDGNLTIYKTELENNNYLQLVGEPLLKDILISLNTDLDGKKGYATAIEALIAAIFMDKGYDETYKFIKKYIIK